MEKYTKKDISMMRDALLKNELSNASADNDFKERYSKYCTSARIGKLKVNKGNSKYQKIANRNFYIETIKGVIVSVAAFGILPCAMDVPEPYRTCIFFPAYILGTFGNMAVQAILEKKKESRLDKLDSKITNEEKILSNINQAMTTCEEYFAYRIEERKALDVTSDYISRLSYVDDSVKISLDDTEDIIPEGWQKKRLI